MSVKSKKSKILKSNKNDERKKHISIPIADFDELDLGDADGSSGNLGMDNFKRRTDKNQLPSEKGRIAEL